MPTELTSKQIELRRRIRAKGRSHYIFYTGVLRAGVAMFLINIFSDWHRSYRWHIPPRGDIFIVCAYIAFNLALWLALGYFFGVTMWKRMGFEDSTGIQPNTTAKN